MEQGVTIKETDSIVSLYHYSNLIYKILGYSKIKRRNYNVISAKTIISGPKM